MLCCEHRSLNHSCPILTIPCFVTLQRNSPLWNLLWLEVYNFRCYFKTVRQCRSILPDVKHLGVACNGLTLCDSCNCWPQSSLQILFRRASAYTQQRLRNSPEIEVSPIRHDSWRCSQAVKLEKGQLLHPMEEDVWLESIEMEDALSAAQDYQLLPLGEARYDYPDIWYSTNIYHEHLCLGSLVDSCVRVGSVRQMRSWVICNTGTTSILRKSFPSAYSLALDFFHTMQYWDFC